MKTPLRYQVTEYDCGTTSLLNALSFLFSRDEIPVEIIKEIFTSTLDNPDSSGIPGKKGTSKEAISKISKWLNNYSKINSFLLECGHLIGENVTFEKIKTCINENGCVLLRTLLKEEHYVIITKIDTAFIYIFDPYYLSNEYFQNKKEIDLLNDIFNFNRKVLISYFIEDTEKDFTIGPISKREILLLKRKSDD